MRLRKELGVEGYGIFFMLLEVLRDQIDFKYPLKDIDLLAEEFGCSEQKLRVVICNYQLFEVDPEEQFFSPKLLLYLQPYLERSRRAIEANEIRWGKHKQLKEGNTNGIQMDSETESKSESKEIKVNKNIYSAFFEEVWKLYPNKKGKGQVSDTAKGRLYKVGTEQLTRCIERYKATKPSWQQYQNGSTFFNSGYVDYLDENFQSEPEEQSGPYRRVD